MKSIFLESHNLKNKFSGFGQFNFHLINGLKQIENNPFEITLHSYNIKQDKEAFGDGFKYKKYSSLSRHQPFRIKKKYNLWHCLNQNIKVEPFYNIPYLLTVHDIHFIKEGSEKTQKKMRALFTQKLKRAKAITYISNFVKQDTHQHFDIPNIPEYVIYNGNTITNKIFSKNITSKININTPYLFSIGEFTPRKNFKSLVNFLTHLNDYHLVLSGKNTTSYGEELVQLVHQLNLQDRVHITGKIDDDQKIYLLKNCEAFLFPSLREGFGIPPIEAMFFGKPVFLSNNTSLPEVGGEKCFYWDHYNPEYMAEVFTEGMQIFKSNQKQYEQYYKQRSQSFCWKTTAKQYLDVYKSILNEV